MKKYNTVFKEGLTSMNMSSSGIPEVDYTKLKKSNLKVEDISSSGLTSSNLGELPEQPPTVIEKEKNKKEKNKKEKKTMKKYKSLFTENNDVDKIVKKIKKLYFEYKVEFSSKMEKSVKIDLLNLTEKLEDLQYDYDGEKLEDVKAYFIGNNTISIIPYIEDYDLEEEVSELVKEYLWSL